MINVHVENYNSDMPSDFEGQMVVIELDKTKIKLTEGEAIYLSKLLKELL